MLHCKWHSKVTDGLVQLQKKKCAFTQLRDGGGKNGLLFHCVCVQWLMGEDQLLLRWGFFVCFFNFSSSVLLMMRACGPGSHFLWSSTPWCKNPKFQRYEWLAQTFEENFNKKEEEKLEQELPEFPAGRIRHNSKKQFSLCVVSLIIQLFESDQVFMLRSVFGTRPSVCVCWSLCATWSRAMNTTVCNLFLFPKKPYCCCNIMKSLLMSYSDWTLFYILHRWLFIFLFFFFWF